MVSALIEAVKPNFFLPLMIQFAECLNQGVVSVMFCCMLDFSKAFDKVPHTHLCNKLHHYGIHGALLSWLHASFFTQ